MTDEDYEEFYKKTGELLDLTAEEVKGVFDVHVPLDKTTMSSAEKVKIYMETCCELGGLDHRVIYDEPDPLFGEITEVLLLYTAVYQDVYAYKTFLGPKFQLNGLGRSALYGIVRGSVRYENRRNQ